MMERMGTIYVITRGIRREGIFDLLKSRVYRAIL